MSRITSIDQLDLNKRYTYADYLTWEFKERVELIKGRLFRMSPAPNRRHQAISSNLHYFFAGFLRGKVCKVYHAPFDVRLIRNGKDTVVQPDISVICDEDKLDDQGCNGSPDIVVEILSPGNSQKERKEKFALYEENAIPEYWMVEPAEEFVTVYSLNEKGVYIGSKPYIDGEVIVSNALPGFSIEVADIFTE
ncbi:MAG: Uma2 family endonuclease [Bacteroidota bacterium]